MINQMLHCPYCDGIDIVRHGTTPEGKQRYRCRECPDRGRTFLLEYTYAGQSPEVKQQIVEMAMNAKGLQQRLQLQKDRILPSPEDVRQHGATLMIDGMPQPPRLRFLPHVTPHFIEF